MCIGIVRVSMHVRFTSVPVHVRVNHAGTVLGSETFGDPACETSQIQHAQENEHQSNGQFHCQADAGWNGQIEYDDSGAHQHDRDGVPEAPQDADDPRVPDTLLPAHDGRDRNDVVWIGGVPDAQQKPHANDREEINHKQHVYRSDITDAGWTTIQNIGEVCEPPILATDETTPASLRHARALSASGVSGLPWARSRKKPRKIRSYGCCMALELVRTRVKNSPWAFQMLELLPVFMVGVGVIFASLGMGEAVYRLLFADYDGAKDRLPIEALFGLIFAWVATSFVRSIYQHRKRTDAKLNLIWDRSHKIRAALEAISPHPHASRNQQSIRVIREEVDRIEGALKEVLSR